MEEKTYEEYKAEAAIAARKARIAVAVGGAFFTLQIGFSIIRVLFYSPEPAELLVHTLTVWLSSNILWLFAWEGQRNRAVLAISWIRYWQGCAKRAGVRVEELEDELALRYANDDSTV